MSVSQGACASGSACATRPSPADAVTVPSRAITRGRYGRGLPVAVHSSLGGREHLQWPGDVEQLHVGKGEEIDEARCVV